MLPCNVFARQPLLETDSLCDSGDGFDVIISTLCLEFAAVSLDEFKLAVSNIVSLLLPSGYLILQVVDLFYANATHYESITRNKVVR